jgi:hypothetical protein
MDVHGEDEMITDNDIASLDRLMSAGILTNADCDFVRSAWGMLINGMHNAKRGGLGLGR